MNSFFESLAPRSSIVKKYIAYFYFDQSDDPSFEKKYSFFPHTYTTLSFYKNAIFDHQENVYHISGAASQGILSLLTRQQSIKTVLQTGSLYKIGIVFYPLGLNHFIAESYDTLAQHDVQLFHPGNKEEWNDIIEKCFSCTSNEARQAILENFLLTLYRPKPLDKLQAAVEMITDVTRPQTIQAIAEAVYISPRSLNRLFRKELAMTPETCRVIARFRYIMQQKTMVKDNQKLTTLAYESGYFDQASLTRTFKRFTNLSPKQFFRQCSLVGENGTVWFFHNTKNVV